MTYQLAGERYRGLFAEDLDHDVARRWLDEAHGWFDAPPGGGEVGSEDAPGDAAPGAARLALVESPLGLGVAKEVAPGRLPFRRRRRALGTFAAALSLGAAGIATPRPLAALVPRRGADPAAFVAERVEAPTLAAWAAAGAPGDRAALAEAFADTLARLHRSGLRHRDLKAPNVLVEADVPGVWLIDLDGVRRRRRPGIARRRWRDRARDLARLLLSLQVLSAPRLDLERELWRPLLLRYGRATGDAATSIDAWAHGWAARHAARNRRRGRPVT